MLDTGFPVASLVHTSVSYLISGKDPMAARFIQFKNSKIFLLSSKIHHARGPSAEWLSRREIHRSYKPKARRDHPLPLMVCTNSFNCSYATGSSNIMCGSPGAIAT